MELILKKRGNRMQRIDYYFSALKRSQPKKLEDGLKMMYLRLVAQKLDDAVLDNNITMQEIVDEVRKERKVLAVPVRQSLQLLSLSAFKIAIGVNY